MKEKKENMAITAKKAIQILDIDQRTQIAKVSPDLIEARALALHGLKAINFARATGKWHPAALLPGELPEQLELKVHNCP